MREKAEDTGHSGEKIQRIFEVAGEDLREAGLLVLVFLIIDYVVPGSSTTRHTALVWAAVSGLSSFLLGYIVEWRRKP